jgi:hypothetical protein
MHSDFVRRIIVNAVPADARRLARHHARPTGACSIDGRLDAYHPDFERPDPMLSGRNMSRFDVATDQMGEARHTAMTHVKSPSG